MTGRRRLTGADVVRLLVSWFLAFLALLLTPLAAARVHRHLVVPRCSWPRPPPGWSA